MKPVRVPGSGGLFEPSTKLSLDPRVETNAREQIKECDDEVGMMRGGWRRAGRSSSQLGF